MRRPSPQAGYNLVMLMVLLTVLNIMIAASLPAWSAVIRRDKEEELIFRGLQYAEAIRLFKNRFERDPVRLEELIEVKPRTIRKLWKDPMTEDGKWALIPAQGPGPVVNQGNGNNGLDGDGRDPGQNGNPDEQPPGEGEDQQGQGQGPGFGPKKGEIQVGPFKGVHSKSRKTSFLLFNGKDHYDEWHFTTDLLMGGNAQQPPGMGPGSPEGVTVVGQMPQRIRWVGRPLPEFLQPRQGTGLPQDDDRGSGAGDDENPDGRGNGRRKP